MPGETDYHVAITRVARPGKEADFEAALHRFARDSLGFPGTTGVHILRPTDDKNPREFGILRSFSSRAKADAFYESDLFGSWVADTAGLVDDKVERRELHGLECFFRQLSAAPKRWKMAVVTWLGVFPTVVFWIAVLNGLDIESAEIVKIAIATLLTVASLTWVIMPRLVKVFSNWLHHE